jgi:hypothetical protein
MARILRTSIIPMAQCHLVQVFAPAYAMAFFHAHNKRKANWT